VLSDGTDTYLYGLDRLATVDNSGTRTWALHDALGSVRLSLDDTGTPIYASGYGYSPFGVLQSGAQPAPFGIAARTIAYAYDGLGRRPSPHAASTSPHRMSCQ
jgi:hypothetical protein